MTKRLEHLTIEELGLLGEHDKVSRTRTLDAWLVYAAANGFDDEATEEGLDTIRRYPAERLKPLRKALVSAARLPDLLAAAPTAPSKIEPADIAYIAPGQEPIDSIELPEVAEATVEHGLDGPEPSAMPEDVHEEQAAEAEETVDPMLNGHDDGAKVEHQSDESLGLSKVGLTWLTSLFPDDTIARFKTMPPEQIAAEIVTIAQPPQSYVEGDKSKPVDAASRIARRLRGMSYEAIGREDGTSAAGVQVWLSKSVTKPIKSGSGTPQGVEDRNEPTEPAQSIDDSKVATELTPEEDGQQELELSDRTQPDEQVEADLTAVDEQPVPTPIEKIVERTLPTYDIRPDDSPQMIITERLTKLIDLDTMSRIAMYGYLNPRPQTPGLNDNRIAVIEKLIVNIEEELGGVLTVIGSMEQGDADTLLQILGLKIDNGTVLTSVKKTHSDLLEKVRSDEAAKEVSDTVFGAMDKLADMFESAHLAAQKAS